MVSSGHWVIGFLAQNVWSVAGNGDRPTGGNQPDPMKTSLGYIGADSFSRSASSSSHGGPNMRFQFEVFDRFWGEDDGF